MPEKWGGWMDGTRPELETETDRQMDGWMDGYEDAEQHTVWSSKWCLAEQGWLIG